MIRSINQNKLNKKLQELKRKLRNIIEYIKDLKNLLIQILLSLVKELNYFSRICLIIEKVDGKKVRKQVKQDLKRLKNFVKN